MWLKGEGFKYLLKGWWTSYNFSGSYNFVLASKLKVLKSDLKVWNKEVFGNVSISKEGDDSFLVEPLGFQGKRSFLSKEDA